MRTIFPWHKEELSCVEVKLQMMGMAVVQVLISARHSEMRVAHRVLSEEGKEMNSVVSSA